MNIYDYINSPSGAVRNGYKPCYITKVSAVINRAYSKEAWEHYMPSISIDDSVREFTTSLWLIFLMTLIRASMPFTCWILAFWMPGGKAND